MKLLPEARHISIVTVATMALLSGACKKAPVENSPAATPEAQSVSAPRPSGPVFENPGDPFGSSQSQQFGLSTTAQALIPQIQPSLTEAYAAHLTGDYAKSLPAFKGYFEKMVALWPTSQEVVSYYFEGRPPGSGSFEPLPTKRVVELVTEDMKGALSRPASGVEPQLIKDICGLLRAHFMSFSKEDALSDIERRLTASARQTRGLPELLDIVRQEVNIDGIKFDSDSYESVNTDLMTLAARSTEPAWGAYLSFLAGERHLAVLGKTYQLPDTQEQAVAAYSLAVSSYPGAAFPIDDAHTGAKKGSPIEPYARLRLSRIYGNWLQGNSVNERNDAAKAELEAIIAKFRDPELMVLMGPHQQDQVSVLGSAMAGLIRIYGPSEQGKGLALLFAKDFPNMKFAWNGWWVGETRPEAYQMLAQIEPDNTAKASYLRRIIKEHPKAWTGKFRSDDGGAYAVQAFRTLLSLAKNPDEEIAIAKQFSETKENVAVHRDASARLKELTLHRDATKIFKTPASKEILGGPCVTTYHFDASVYSEADIERFTKYSPVSGHTYPFDREQKQAELRAAIPTLPAALRPVLECYLEEHAFYIEFDGRKSKFLSTGDVEQLKRPIAGIDPKAICAGAIDLAVKEKNPEQRSNIVNLHWGNPINAIFRKRLCSAEARWGDFLKKSNIHAIASNCDGE